jgi:hypothetical protein
MCSHSLAEVADGTRPLEIIEREITTLTSQIHAATCRWLCLIAEYDARGGWAQWGCRSCAHWVSWQCGIAPGPAREHVRVARRLQELPLIRGAFAEGELSYSKVRALTRVENVEREADLLVMARHATAAQLERLVRAHRRVLAAERVAAGARPERWISYEHDDDGSMVLHGRLPAEEGALVLAALDAACERLARDDVPAGTPAVPESEAVDVPAGTPSPPRREARADALLALADAYLAGAQGSRTGAARHEVVVHVDIDALSEDGAGERCELEDGEPLARDTARRLACDASILQVLERDGVPLKLGRKARTVPPAMRRALAARDRHCRFPGCTARRFIDAHHIRHWADGGATNLDNLVQLCGHHHRLLHEGRYRIASRPSGGLVFCRRDGRRIEACPARPSGRPAVLEATRRPDACVGLGTGERMHLGWAVEAMLDFAPPAPAEAPGL